MRNAYAIVGIAGLIVFLGAAYAFNRSSTQSGDTVQNQARTDASISMAPSTLTLTSSAFAEGASIPSRFTCDGDRSVSPALSIAGVPADTREIPEGTSVGVAGANGAGKNAYTGPCPPPQYEPSEHRYVFKLYALDSELALQQGATKADVEKAMEGHIVAQAQLVGRYKRI